MKRTVANRCPDCVLASVSERQQISSLGRIRSENSETRKMPYPELPKTFLPMPRIFPNHSRVQPMARPAPTSRGQSTYQTTNQWDFTSIATSIWHSFADKLNSRLYPANLPFSCFSFSYPADKLTTAPLDSASVLEHSLHQVQLST
jgi:hypothetical protein